MAKFNGDINLDGVLIFPSGADDRMAIRSIATESITGQAASGQLRFLSVGNEEGYWYLQNNPTAGLFDFDAGSFPSGQRIATLGDIATSIINDDGQTSINGLSGVVLITSPDGTILVGDGGQAIELSGLFTQASGAVLQQKCEDIITLSGLVTSHTDAGQTSVEGVSGVIDLDSPDNSVNINVNGQIIELTTPTSGAPSGASYLLREYNDNGHLTQARILSATSGIRLVDDGARSNSGLVATLDFDNEPSVNQVLIWNGSRLEWTNQTGGGGGSDDAGQTSINGLSGVLSLISPDNTILIGDSPQAIELSGLFTQASGAVLQQKCEDILTLSGSIGSLALDDLSDVTVTSPSLGELLAFNGTTWVNQASSGMVTTMVRVASTTVFTDTDVVSFSGLDGNVDKRYQLICEFVDSLGNTSEVSYRLTFNDDHTVANYGWSEIISNDTGLAAASENAGDQDGIRIAFNNTGGDSTKNLSHAIVDILARAGLPRLVQCSNTRPGASGSIDTEGIALVHGRWSDLESNITEINITASTAGNDIGSGTRITLYAEQDVDLNNTFLPVDARAVTGSIVPDTSGIYDLGAKNLKYANVHSVSGIFGGDTVTISDNLIIDFPETTGRGAIINCRNSAYADTALLIDIDRSGSAAFNCILALTNGASDAVFQVDGLGRILNRALFVDPLTTQQAIEIDQETGHNAQSVLSTTRNTSYSSIMHFVRCARVANSAYSFLLTQSDPFGTPDTMHNLRGDGGLFSDIAAATPADYAEYFECAHPSGIPAGYPVSINPQGKIRVATKNSYVIGFVSAAPAYIADAAWSRWQGKYLKDDFGGRVLNKAGNRVLSPAWNSGLPYIPREDRPEWVTVGLVGKLWTRHYGEIVRPGDYVAVGVSGMVHKATNEAVQWLVIERGRNFNDKRGYGTTRILYR